MPPVGFEPTIPVFEWAKTVHALDRAAIVISMRTTCHENAFTISIHKSENNGVMSSSLITIEPRT
jgi:hypothetical protein